MTIRIVSSADPVILAIALWVRSRFTSTEPERTDASIVALQVLAIAQMALGTTMRSNHRT